MAYEINQYLAFLTVATDFSLLQEPVQAMRNMLVNCTLQFTTPLPDASRHQKDAARREFAPGDWYQNIEERDNRRARACDLYVARLPAVFGHGFRRFRANPAAPVFEYLRFQTPRIFILIGVQRQLPHILAECRNLNMYNLYGDVMSSQCNGIPHSKKRSYCVGILQRFDNGNFAFPAAIECPGLESMLERRASLHRLSGKTRCLPPRSSRTARDNVIRVDQELQRAGQQPHVVPHVINIDASRGFCNTMADKSPCLNSSQCHGHGPWITSRSRRMTKEEIARLQGMNPRSLSDVWCDKTVLGAESVNVLERVLASALPAAGLVAAVPDDWANGKRLRALEESRGKGFKRARQV